MDTCLFWDMIGGENSEYFMSQEDVMEDRALERV